MCHIIYINVDYWHCDAHELLSRISIMPSQFSNVIHFSNLVQKRNNDHAMRRELVYRILAPRIHEKCNIKKLLQVTIFVVVAN